MIWSHGDINWPWSYSGHLLPRVQLTWIAWFWSACYQNCTQSPPKLRGRSHSPHLLPCLWLNSCELCVHETRQLSNYFDNIQVTHSSAILYVAVGKSTNTTTFQQLSTIGRLVSLQEHTSQVGNQLRHDHQSGQKILCLCKILCCMGTASYLLL